MKILLGAVLLLCLASAQAGVAPGDENSRCMEDLAPYPTNMRMLMSSRHYTQLLGEDGAVWDQRDFDNNNPESPITPTYFMHNAGGVCRWSVMSCGYRDGRQENWLFTQFIALNTPEGTDYSVTAIIDVLYTLSSCRERYNCNPTFKMYMFKTDGPKSRDVYTTRSNYELIKKRKRSSPLTQNVVVKVNIPPSVAGFYIAVLDNSSCIQVAQMKVYRHQCTEKQEGLVVFPERASPSTPTMNVTSLCMPNSRPVTSMTMTCDKTGAWGGSGRCKCNPGYKRVPAEEGDECEACPAGYYRSERDPEGVCLSCPANTDMDEVAQPFCPCLAGYFRNTEGLGDEYPANQVYEDVSSDCTKPPSMPLDLDDTATTDTSISIRWRRPESDGGRHDLYYRVHYSDPDSVGVMLEAECVNVCQTRTCTCTIRGLRAATAYVIRVSAHNGVSDQDRGGALARMKEITVTTDIAPPSAPQSAQSFCDVLVWEKPAVTNGDILGYSVAFAFPNRTTSNSDVEGEKCFFVLPSSLPRSTRVDIRARNAAGMGDRTRFTVQNDCVLPTPSSTDCVEPDPTTVTRTLTTTRPAVTTTQVQTRTRTVTRVTTTTQVVTDVTTVDRTVTRTTSTPCPTPPPDTINISPPSDSTTEATTDATTPTVFIPTLPSCASSDRTPPGSVGNVEKVGCRQITWDPVTVEGCVDDGLKYKVRVYSGLSFDSTPKEQRKVFTTTANSLSFSASDVPAVRPLRCTVKARTSNGVFSPEFSPEIVVSETFAC